MQKKIFSSKLGKNKNLKEERIKVGINKYLLPCIPIHIGKEVKGFLNLLTI